MKSRKFPSEAALMRAWLARPFHQWFRKELLARKSEHEAAARSLLVKHRGRYSAAILNEVFDLIDLYEGQRRWFGQLLSVPNRRLIVKAGDKALNDWLGALLWAPASGPERLDACLAPDRRPKGASRGVATLLLYLLWPARFNIWLDATATALETLGRYDGGTGDTWGERYAAFNTAACEFRQRHRLDPHEMDFVLSDIAIGVSRVGRGFVVPEDKFAEVEQSEGQEEPRGKTVDDLVGEPMELRVMRWSPTNEMGVVALFIEFRKELGFPIIEVIRSRYPDACVYQQVKKGGHVKRYIEFEYRASGFKSHLKSNARCDYVVCWINDWPQCPVEVIELRQAIPRLLTQAAAVGKQTDIAQ